MGENFARMNFLSWRTIESDSVGRASRPRLPSILQPPLENLKKRETIGWYRDIRLYDDELDDNGAVSLAIKIRIMPSCFFILVRYYLRVDKGTLVKQLTIQFA